MCCFDGELVLWSFGSLCDVSVKSWLSLWSLGCLGEVSWPSRWSLCEVLAVLVKSLGRLGEVSVKSWLSWWSLGCLGEVLAVSVKSWLSRWSLGCLEVFSVPTLGECEIHLVKGFHQTQSLLGWQVSRSRLDLHCADLWVLDSILIGLWSLYYFTGVSTDTTG